MSSFGKFVFGAALGGAAGAFLALLFAPRSGKETRRMIREDLDERCSASAEAVKEVVNEKVGALKEKAEEVGCQLKDSATALKEKASALSEELEETGRKGMTDLKDKSPNRA